MPPSLLIDEPDTHWDAPLVLTAAASFCALWFWQVRNSVGFLEADACTHYQIARYAFAEPFRFVDVWGRPLKTLLYATPAWFGGRLGVQCMSLALALGIAFIAMLIAQLAGLRRPALAFIFTLAQPLLFLHSFSELTELPFAFTLALAALAALKRWWKTFALLAGLLPLARPEGFAFLAAAAIGLLVGQLLRKRWPSHAPPWTVWLLLPLGLVAWSLAGWLLSGREGSPLTWIPAHWPYAGDSVYTVGKKDGLWRLSKFTLVLPAITSPLVFPALLVGLALALAAGKRWVRALLTTADTTPAVQARTLTLFIAGAILVGHSLLYFLGKMATNGELRYMLIVAPFWAILAALGWSRIFELLTRPPAEAGRFALYAAALPIFLNTHFYRVLPLQLESAGETARFVARWADEYSRTHNRPRIMAADPMIYYFLGRSNMDRARSIEFTAANVAAAPPGTLLLYDPIYCRFNSDLGRTVSGTGDLTAHGWQEVPHFNPGGIKDGWRVFLSPQ